MNLVRRWVFRKRYIMVQNSVSNSEVNQTISNETHFTDDGDLEPKESWFYRTFPMLKWNRSSPLALKDIEEKFLSYVQTKSRGWYADSGDIGGQPVRIWTRLYQHEDFDKNDNNKPIPLVMLHGMAAGNAFFCLNFDALARNRPVYALDLPGFARSSRPKFSSDHQEAEKEFVKSIEEWRKSVGLEKFCILGHSFGGYLSASYALKHPERVSHLILADPWGFKEKPEDLERKYNIPWYIKGLYNVFKHFNPLAAFRMMGPLSTKAITRARPDLIRKFDPILEEQSLHIIPNYIFHCNVQNPTGESAFHSLMTGFAWAKDPMLPRLSALSPTVPLTAIYGANSWVDAIPKEDFLKITNRCDNDSYTNVELIEDARHHVYADNHREFNFEVNKACNLTQ